MSSVTPTVYLLMLGGIPTCAGADVGQDDSAGLVAEIAKQAAHLAVLGIGPKRPAWDQIAKAGGTSNVFSTSELSLLITTIDQMAKTIAACSFALPNPPLSSASSASCSSVMLWKYCASMTFSSAVRYGMRWNA